MIELHNLTKRYGDTVAVDGIDATIRPGVVTGFLGPNGAGKSTTMRIILGLDKPTSGTALVNGKPYADSVAPIAEVGALLDAKGVDTTRSARNHLLALGATVGIGHRRVDEVLGIVGLSEVGDKPAGKFSLGMGQRLGIASALLADPSVLILDEPVNGLDLDGIQWIRSLLTELAAEGRTVLLSSHLMSEMELVADHLLVIGQGRILADTPIRDFISRSSTDLVTVASPDAAELAGRLSRDGATVATDTRGRLKVHGVDAARIGELAAAGGLRLHALTPAEASLETAYLELTRGSVQYSGVVTASAASTTAPSSRPKPFEGEAQQGPQGPAMEHAHAANAVVTVQQVRHAPITSRPGSAPYEDLNPPTAAYRETARRRIDGEPRARQTFSRAVNAEWIKLRTLRSTWTGMGAILFVLVGFGALAAAMATGTVTAPEDGGGPFDSADPLATVLTGSTFAVLLAGVLGSLAGAREYGSRIIAATVASVPRRWQVVAAKSVVVAAVFLFTALAGVFAAYGIGTAVLSANDAPTVDIGDDRVLTSLLGMAAYITAIALIGLGLGILLRSTASSIGAVVAGVLILPGIAGALLPESWDSVLQYLPTSAAAAFTTVTSAGNEVLPGPTGAIVLAAWVIAALAAATVAITRRDT